MKKPQVGQLVWVEKLQGTFTIVAFHGERKVVDLQLLNGNGAIEKDVAIELIHALGGDVSPMSD